MSSDHDAPKPVKGITDGKRDQAQLGFLPRATPRDDSLDARRELENLSLMIALTFRAPDPLARKIRAAARRRGVPLARFIREAAEREATQEIPSFGPGEPNAITAAAIREPAGGLPKYRTLDDAWHSLKSDAKRRSKKPVPA